MLLVTEFTNERGETYTVLQLLKRLRMAIIQIDGILFEHQERINILEIDVEEIKNNIDDIKEQLLNIVNRVDIVENKVEIVEETLINIENNITSIETILSNHAGDILALNTLVTNITTELNELQGIVDSIPIVSASALNGYIKIDGVDTPVFVGGGSGGSGGGSVMFTYPYTRDDFPQGSTVIGEFDVPDYDDTICLSSMLQMYSKSHDEFSLYIDGYDENNIKTQIKKMDAANSSTGYEFSNHIFNIVLFKDGDGYCYNWRSDSPGNDNAVISNRIAPELSSISCNKIKRIVVRVYRQYTSFEQILKPFIISMIGGNGGSGGSDESNSTVYTTKLNTLTNDDLNIYKNIWTLPCPPSAIGENSRFEYDATYAMSVAEIDEVNFQCSIMGAEMNLGEININRFEEDFIYMKINLIGGTRKINDTEYFTSSNIEVIISNTNTSTKTSRVLARLNSNRGGSGVIGVDDNIHFNLMFTGDEVEDRNSPMARGMLKRFYNIKELI